MSECRLAAFWNDKLTDKIDRVQERKTRRLASSDCVH